MDDKMNLDFTKINLAEARNREGSAVRSVDRELMEYTKSGYKVFVEISFSQGCATAYEPVLPLPLPSGMTDRDVLQEIHIGVAVTAECDVEWRTG